MDERSRVEKWLARNSSVSLVAAGIALVVLAVVVHLPEATSTALAVMGAAMAIVGCLLPNLEGNLKVGPGGIEAFLRSVDARATEKGLDADDRALAVGEAYVEALEVVAALNLGRSQRQLERSGDATASARAGGEGARAEPGDLAERIINELTEMVPIKPAAVPDEAKSAVREASNDQTLGITSAERRSGRGAPRWHLTMTDGSRWRVSNTVHGWTATRRS